MINRGAETPPPLKSADLSELEPRLSRYHNKLEHDRSDPGRDWEVLQAPLQGADRETDKYPDRLHPALPSLYLSPGSSSMVRIIRGPGIVQFNRSLDDFAVLAVLVCDCSRSRFSTLKEQWRVKNLENALPELLPGSCGNE